MTSRLLYAAFERPHRAAAAVWRLRADGHAVLDAFAPSPDEALLQATRPPPSRVRAVMLIAGVAGAAFGLGMQVWSAVADYPVNSGGRPPASWPAFIPVAFELGVLFAAIAGFVAFLIEARLTRLNAPELALEDIERASRDRTLILIETERMDEARKLLSSAGAVAISEGEP